MVGPSTWITKGSLNFATKAWRTLVHHRLSPTNGDNMLSPERATLVIGIIEGYDIDVAKIIARDIRDWAVSTGTTLAFPCILM